MSFLEIDSVKDKFFYFWEICPPFSDSEISQFHFLFSYQSFWFFGGAPILCWSHGSQCITVWGGFSGTLNEEKRHFLMYEQYGKLPQYNQQLNISNIEPFLKEQSLYDVVYTLWFISDGNLKVIDIKMLVWPSIKYQVFIVIFKNINII